MARQTAEKFLELLATNQNLQTHQWLADAWSIPALTHFASVKGFLFSEADLKAAMESFSRQRQTNKR